MSRSSWKSKYINMENYINLKKKLKIQFRDQVIPLSLENSKVLIYTGQRYISVFID